MNRALIALAVAAAGFAAGWAVNGWRLTSQHEAEARERATQALRQLEHVTADRDRLAGALAQSNDTQLTALKGMQDETNRLRDCLRTGRCGLRVAASCPDPTGAQGTTGTGLGAGAGARLDPDAEPAYFALREGIQRTQRKLAACQEQLTLRTASP